MAPEQRQWTLALLAAGGLHALVAIGLLWPQAEPGAQAPGVGGIEIALGPAGGAPGGAAAPTIEDVQEAPDAAAPETVAEPEVEGDTPEPIVEPDPVEPEPEPDPVEPEPEPVEENPEPVVEEEPPPEELSTEAVATETTPAQPAPTAAPRPLPKDAPETRAPTPSTAGAAGKAGSQDSAEAGASGSDASAGGTPGAEADYAAIVLAWLERHKEYPPPAQRRRQEGVVLLYIAIDRKGQVLERRLAERTGHTLLDEAALAMLARAAPLPPMPEDMAQQRLEMVVPVQFFLR